MSGSIRATRPDFKTSVSRSQLVKIITVTIYKINDSDNVAHVMQ